MSLKTPSGSRRRSRSLVEFSFAGNPVFGDNWKHTATVEKPLSDDTVQAYPVCVAGRGECPAEDSADLGCTASAGKAKPDPNRSSDAGSGALLRGA